MSFKSDERIRQLSWKNHTDALSSEARERGLYTGARRGQERQRDEMFLHEDHSEENLLPHVRQQALDVFRQAGIDWHDGPDGRTPSNYLMDSMVASINCLMPFANDGAALAALFRPLQPDAVHAEPVDEGRVLSFEWMGVGNPLGEPSRKRKRGSYGTSADAFCALKRVDGGITGLLIEWKYTESYLMAQQKRGAAHYQPLLEAPDSPVDLTRCGGAKALAVDPLYQLARAQLLAHATERERVLGCDRVICLVLVPDGNSAYRDHVPSPSLRERYPKLGLADVWASLLQRPDRFALTSFDTLLASFPSEDFPLLTPALAAVKGRYFRGALGDA